MSGSIATVPRVRSLSEGLGWRIGWLGDASRGPHLAYFSRVARNAGALVLAYLPGTAPSRVCDVRIIEVGAYADQEALRREYGHDKSPVLFLAATSAQAELAHKFAGTADDVDLLGTSPQILLRRLERMHDRLAALELARDRGRRDELTGLLNRCVAESEWQVVPGCCKDEPATLFLLDLDHLSEVNEHHGPQVGDQVLKVVAEVLLRHVPSEDLLCRFAGEEFAWIAKGLTQQECQAHAESVLDALRCECHGSGKGIFKVTASVGFANLVPDEPLTSAFEAAEQALYAAKAAGRDQAHGRDQLETAAAELNSDVRLIHFQNVTRAITEHAASLLSCFGRSLLQQAQHAADQDALTQTWNRRYFDRRFAREIKHARAHNTPLSIAVFDLDHFGQFNRQHGLPTGDAVLREFVRVVLSCIRATDWFARYGGEEFVLVMREPLEPTLAVAERVRSAFARVAIAHAGGSPVHCTVSAGVATLLGDIVHPVQLILLASKRLQVAKRSGRDRVVGISSRPERMALLRGAAAVRG